MTINIFGTEYTLADEDVEKNPKLEDNDGLCEVHSKRIIIDTSDNNDNMNVEDSDKYYHQVLRHEAFHAIFHEVGLTKYHIDEDLVEALAILYPKIKPIMLALDSIDIKKIKEN